MKQLPAWMDAVEPGLPPDDDLAKVIRYYKTHLKALFRFVDHPEIPIDNSATEREYQNVAKLRHARLFAGSTEGAHCMATLLGIVATCRTLDVDAKAYLAWGLHAPRHPPRGLRTDRRRGHAGCLQARTLRLSCQNRADEASPRDLLTQTLVRLPGFADRSLRSTRTGLASWC